LGCPFGCAEEHRQREWRRSSAEYYEDSDGKRRKSQHNQRQGDRRKADGALAKLPQPARLPEAEEEEIPVTVEIPAPLVNYVQRVVSGIEGRRVSREEILERLAQEKSPPSLVRQRRVDQIIRTLHERPP
jgi:hypothetical protein